MNNSNQKITRSSELAAYSYYHEVWKCTTIQKQPNVLCKQINKCSAMMFDNDDDNCDELTL